MWNIWRTYGDGSKPYTPGEHQNSSGLWISVLQCIVERFFESINNLLAFSPSSQICLEKYDTYWNKSTARSHSWWHPSHSRGHKRDVHRSFGSTPSPSVARSSIGSPALSTQRRISPTNITNEQVLEQHSSLVTPTWSTFRSFTAHPSPQDISAQRGSQQTWSESPTHVDRYSEGLHKTPHWWSSQVWAPRDNESPKQFFPQGACPSSFSSNLWVR